MATHSTWWVIGNACESMPPNNPQVRRVFCILRDGLPGGERQMSVTRTCRIASIPRGCPKGVHFAMPPLPAARHVHSPLLHRVLLEDDCTLGPRGGRIFSYERAAGHLVGSEFAELVKLVKLGRVGTVGTSVERLRGFGLQRAREGCSVVLGFGTSDETPRERAVRTRSRSVKNRPKVNSCSPATSQQR